MRRQVSLITVLSTSVLLWSVALQDVHAQAASKKKSFYGQVKPAGPYSPAVMAGEFLFLSGQVGRDPATNTLVAGGTKAETRQAMENLGKLLAEAGLGFEDAVKVTVFLADNKDFADMNEIYASFFPGGVPPARSTVQAAPPGGARVEIDMVAIRK